MTARAGTIAAVAATVTAVVAVIIAISDNVQSRRHNRLSVMPYVVLQRVQSDSAGSIRGAVRLTNAGVGPAILRGLEIRLPADGARDTVLTRWGDAAPLIQSHGVEIRGWMDIDSGMAIATQRDAALLAVAGQDMAALQAFFDVLGVRVRFGSVYGEPGVASLGQWPEER